MNKVYHSLCCIFLMAIIFPGYADLFRDSPALSFAENVEKKPGFEFKVRLDKVLANVIPANSNGRPTARGGIIFMVYWCTPNGTGCTSPDSTPIPEGNILARVSPLCSGVVTEFKFNKVIDCLHSQINSGIYTVTVPSKTWGSGSYPRGMVCLRYQYDIDSLTSIGTFANSDNSCYLSPNQIEWCSLVTPVVNFEFGTLVSSKAQGSSIEKDISVYCTGAVSYRLSLAGNAGSVINLENGMDVDFRLDGQELNKPISSQDEGVISHKLTATLNGTPNTTGAFNSTGVLFVNYP